MKKGINFKLLAAILLSCAILASLAYVGIFHQPKLITVEKELQIKRQ